MVSRSSRRMASTVLTCGVILATGLLASAAASTRPSSGLETHNLRLAYTCIFPSGRQQVGVQVRATMPSITTAGQPIQPTGVQTIITLPPAAVADLSRLGAALAAGGDQLMTVVPENGHPIRVAWRGQTSQLTPVPGKGELALATLGPVSGVPTSQLGRISFTLGRLALAITLRKANGALTDPATLRVACALNPRQNARLATVAVTKPTATSRPGEGRTSPVVAPRQVIHSAKKAKFPPGCAKIPVKGPSAQPVCAWIDGFSNVNKLRGAAELGPGLLNIDLNEKFKITNTNIISLSSAQLFYHGKMELPPTQTTFLTFGFVPVSATLELVELKPISIHSDETLKPPTFKITASATSYLRIRIYNVRVNGEPLDVGSHCQSQSPFKLVLHGKGETLSHPVTHEVGYTVQTGGPLTGLVSVPPFSGCGVGENLDRLFTASISGSHNFTLQTQGTTCGPSLSPSATTCPPPVPKPQRQLKPLPK